MDKKNINSSTCIFSASYRFHKETTEVSLPETNNTISGFISRTPSQSSETATIKFDQHESEHTSNITTEKLSIGTFTIINYEIWDGKIIEVQDEKVLVVLTNRRFPSLKRMAKIKKSFINGDTSNLSLHTSLIYTVKKIRNWNYEYNTIVEVCIARNAIDMELKDIIKEAKIKAELYKQVFDSDNID